MNKKKVFEHMINSPKSIRFNDFVTVAESFGFRCSRQEGSHRIFKNPTVAELINLQDDNGKAKPYQIKQFLSIVEKNNLKIED